MQALLFDWSLPDILSRNDQSSIFKGVYKNFTYILHINFLLRFFPKIKFLLNFCSQKLTFRPIDKCARRVYNKHVLKREQRKGFDIMNTTKRSILTFEFNNKELAALSTARDLLYEVSSHMEDDYLENADAWDNNLHADDVDVAMEVIKILINGGAPTNWEVEE